MHSFPEREAETSFYSPVSIHQMIIFAMLNKWMTNWLSAPFIIEWKFCLSLRMPMYGLKCGVAFYHLHWSYRKIQIINKKICGRFEKMYFPYLDIVLFAPNIIEYSFNIIAIHDFSQSVNFFKMHLMTRPEPQFKSKRKWYTIFSPKRKLQKHAKLMKNMLCMSFFSNNSDIMCTFSGVQCEWNSVECVVCSAHLSFALTRMRIVCSFSDVRFFWGYLLVYLWE